MKFNEIVKTTALSLLSIGVFGAALVGANQFSFANAANRTLEMPPVEAMSVSLPNASEVTTSANNNGTSLGSALSAIGSPGRNLIVDEVEFYSIWGGTHERGENTLSAEEAAQIGAQYIYEIFGECIDGATVQMVFQGHLMHRGVRGVWVGTVGDGIIPECRDLDIPMPIGTPMFIFMLNAETGEAIHVEQATIGGYGIIILTPRSDAPITADWSLRDGLREPIFIERHFSFREDFYDWVLPEVEAWQYSELPDELREFIEEWMQGLCVPSNIRRFTPRESFRIEVVVPNNGTHESGSNQGSTRSS